PEEANFWVSVMVNIAAENFDPTKGADALKKVDAGKAWPREKMFAALRKPTRYIFPEVVLPLAALVPTDELVAFIFSTETQDTTMTLMSALVYGFRFYVRPYLKPAELKRVREQVGAAMPPVAPPSAGYFPLALHLGAALGMHAEVLAHVESWPDNVLEEMGS